MAKRPVVGIALSLALAAVVAWAALSWLGRDVEGTANPSPTDVAAPAPRAPAAEGGASAPATPTPREAQGSRERADASTAEATPDGGLERALLWSAVDLDALRREIPDNLYWEMGAPTDDPAVEEERARERARWNEAWGQVQAGLASEDEIHAYYAHRQQLSTDYIEFASLLLDRHREVLPERDVGLLELAVRMHHTRLQELPRKLSEALERKRKQDALREAWLRDEARFAEPGAEAAGATAP